MNDQKLQDKCRGALVGGAVGDAFGYPVEFVGSFEQIRSRYGDDGVTDYIPCHWAGDECDKALFSDDTQMSLYTAEGILEAERRGVPVIPAVRDAYLAWLGPQLRRNIEIGYKSELLEIEELNQRRAPGHTCLSALRSISGGEKPTNDSKGCGGVMRVAPVGIYGASRGWPIEETARIAGEAAELTHLHPLSTYSSAALAVIVQLCIASGSIDAETFKAIVRRSIDVVTAVYGESAPAMTEFRRIIADAIRMADDPLQDWYIIENELGGGWVAEETLAIAIFSVLRHIDDFSACMISSVNHGGDSDSTGAVAGNIIGAVMGYDAIPRKFLDRLQLLDLLTSMADRLCRHES